MAKERISYDQFLDETKDGLLFSAKFIKRTTGEERLMVCRRGVTIGVTGKGMSYDPAQRNLLTVYDVNKENDRTGFRGAFRQINLDGLIEVHHRGKIWKWDNDKRELVEVR